MSQDLEPGLLAILSRAFHQARAADANQEIARVRQAQGGEVEPQLSYEILLPAREPLRYLVEEVLPRLVYFLDCRGATLPAASGVFATLFLGEELYFLRAQDLLEELGRLAGMSAGEMTRRWGASNQ